MPDPKAFVYFLIREIALEYQDTFQLSNSLDGIEVHDLLVRIFSNLDAKMSKLEASEHSCIKTSNLRV